MIDMQQLPADFKRALLMAYENESEPGAESLTISESGRMYLYKSVKSFWHHVHNDANLEMLFPFTREYCCAAWTKYRKMPAQRKAEFNSKFNATNDRQEAMF